MNKFVTLVFAGLIAVAGVPALAASHAGAQKDDMKKDGMMKKDAMKKDEMKKDGMMKKDEMKK